MNKKILASMLLLFFTLFTTNSFASANAAPAEEVKHEYHEKSLGQLLESFYKTTGIYAFTNPSDDVMTSEAHAEDARVMTTFEQTWGRLIMIAICLFLFYLAIAKGFEPLLLMPIAFGGILANIPLAGIGGETGMLGIIYNMGIANGFFPLLIFMGVGAMTDFTPLLANPKAAILGGAAQFGIFGSLVGAVVLGFDLQSASAISIIGGADGPTSIFIANRLAPELLGAIAVAAYSYMALVPVIQPPIMKALTSEAERKIKMPKLRKVHKLENLTLPIVILLLAILFLPESTPLIGAFCLGNFFKQSGVVERLSDTMQNSLINIVTIFLGLGVGSKLAADKFLVLETLGIMVIGLIAFAAGTAAGVIMAKIMNKFSSDENKINPLIGAAGVSAVPMAARVVSKVGQEYDKSNVLLMHAMGPNVAGVIGSAVAAGVLLSIF
ncbi:sodium ion-translocating decarboxylase subunit beta [Halarcobacter bivalviorum]|uniref:Glutaconyl-CoA decarboxylase subunit beta n=1 Tax=Halarcobacter bivalviorum TaxID=663364 RepID=A0AAN1P8S3_9BACT|nr:sodium ion-translocating decarboxylase subunit beta [Halarcobacter bivalviorum]AXH12297.1 oxaloacetate decarboxylase, beta subunit [Halarcobacter bivalviorum]AXH13095.1 oxaloacetate decarboxylase, beta subunit [Halarcobacter bivalviorum]RXK08838.1 glutaconyl-CoA decarboxylase subunit beta [Halarcobacter bivalviorum]